MFVTKKKNKLNSRTTVGTKTFMQDEFVYIQTFNVWPFSATADKI